MKRQSQERLWAVSREARIADSLNGGKQVANRLTGYFFRREARRLKLVFGKNLICHLRVILFPGVEAPCTLCNNSSDWLGISLFGSCTPQVDRTGSLIRLPTGTLSGSSFLGISFDHRVNKLVQYQHHPRTLVVVPRLWLSSNHWSTFWAYDCKDFSKTGRFDSHWPGFQSH